MELRKLGHADTDAVHVPLSNVEVVRSMLVPLSTAREQSETSLNEGDRGVPGSSVAHTRAICDPSSGELTGLCGICSVAGSRQAELWYLLRPDVWGRGVATEAAREMVAFGFDELKLHRIWATCLPANPASMRVLKTPGMRQEGVQKSSLKVHGVWKDCFLYAVLEEAWRREAT